MAKKGSSKRHYSGHEALDSALTELRTSISSGDVLRAEMQASFLLSLPLLSNGSQAAYGLLADALIDRAEAWGDVPEGAAFLRLLTALGPRPVKRRASEGLANYTDAGIYPPEWVSGIGKPSPGRAYRGRDVFGDREVILVTFSYQDAEHALFVILDLAELPTVVSVDLTMDVSRLLKFFEVGGELVERLEPVALSEARRRIEVPLARAGGDPDVELGEDTLLTLPLARSRVRRLPAPEPGPAISYTAADRAAAVGDFLDSPEAADAGEPDVARFWAQALTGYSGRVPDEPPGQVGRHRLDAALLNYVASTFTLSAGQLSGLEPAVTAWVRWAAHRQGLNEAATSTLMTHLAAALGEFQAACDDPGNVAARGYVRDVARPDADATWLAECRARRELAAPRPEHRDRHCEGIDAADPDGRAVLIASEFGSCEPDGMPKADFLAAAMRVAEELWRDEPATTWQRGKGLLAEGHDRHDVIHLLVEPRYGVKTPPAR
ncbi:MAG TPA: hypothetical protein VMI73_23305 [Trebonia sp.]|nr:hypothetical protein [Trebonia sp.]